MGAAKKPEPEYPVESRTVTYLPAGVGVDPLAGNTPLLDPELAKVREQEIKANDVPVNPAPGEPTIDDALVKAREAELAKDAKRAGVKQSKPAPAESRPSKSKK